MSDYNPTDDELRRIADNNQIGSWTRDLARLVLREREKTAEAWAAHVVASTWVSEGKAEVARLRRTIEELIDQQGTFGASLTDWAEQKARAEKAEAALARVEVALGESTSSGAELRAKVRAALVGDGPPAALGPHEFLPFPTGSGGCFRLLDRSDPHNYGRCRLPAEDPIHSVGPEAGR